MKNLMQTMVLALALAALPAFAVELDEVKADGLVGERADGYLGLVDTSAPDDVVDLVAEINDKRRAEYERIATANDLSVEQVQALAGKKAIARTISGHWILVNGGWEQK